MGGGKPLIAETGGLGGEGDKEFEIGVSASEGGGVVGGLVGDPVWRGVGGEVGDARWRGEGV